MNISIFDVIGPIMVGPSSSHTAGANRLARIARLIAGKAFSRVSFGLYGSFAKTYKGHGTDKALVAGALGFKEDDERLSQSFALAEADGIAYDFYEADLEGHHENSVVITFYDQDEAFAEIIGSSTGGGGILICSINGFETEFTAQSSTLVIRQYDKKGVISNITHVLAENNINIGIMKVSRKAKGGIACCIIETDSPLLPEVVAAVNQAEGVISAQAVNPLSEDGTDTAASAAGSPVREEEGAGKAGYSNIADLLQAASTAKLPLWSVVLQNEIELTGLDETNIFKRLDQHYEVMLQSASRAANASFAIKDSLIGGLSHQQNTYAAQGEGISGGFINKVMARALSGSEVNAAMGRICAAPTAGSCGILPAVLISLGEKYQLSRRQILEGLLTAAGIGAVITCNATVAGAEGGCQAECGSAAAMAAAAAVQMAGGAPAAAAEACSLALINAMGLVCDPVAGLVQMPCAQRNASQAVNALISADLALAGMASIIPADEVIQAMYKVGCQLPAALKETAMGGIAATATAKEITCRMFGCTL